MLKKCFVLILLPTFLSGCDPAGLVSVLAMQSGQRDNFIGNEMTSKLRTILYGDPNAFGAYHIEKKFDGVHIYGEARTKEEMERVMHCASQVVQGEYPMKNCIRICTLEEAKEKIEKRCLDFPGLPHIRAQEEGYLKRNEKLRKKLRWN